CITSDYMQDRDALPIEAIEYSAGGLDNLPIGITAQFARPRPTFRMLAQLIDVTKNPRGKLLGCFRIIQCDVVEDCIQIVQGRFCPDQLSHRRILFFACDWVRTRPSSTARSPRAIPSSRATRWMRAS